LGKRVLRKMLGPKSDEITGGWRKLHDEELYDPYSSPNIIIVIIIFIIITSVDPFWSHVFKSLFKDLP
jgi:hypothetical protein